MVRHGVALSDERKILASPLVTVTAAKTPEETAKLLLKALAPYNPEMLIVGLPLLLSGKDSPMTTYVRLFAKILSEIFTIPILLYDERLSSTQVERLLKDQGYSRKERAKKSDASAAALLLQTYLDSI